MKHNNMVRFPDCLDNFIVPSILSADISNLYKEIKSVEKYSGWIQVDVMDGHFVPNLSFGPNVVMSLRKITMLPIDVHLMVEEPLNFIKAFIKNGADLITVHYESKKFYEAIKLIKKSGKKAGIAIRPGTDFKKIAPYLKAVDLILIMTVEPGFGGQSFIFNMLDKIKEARDYINSKKMKKYIQVDGGISEETLIYALNSGANSFVMGSGLFGKKNPDNIKKIYNLIYGGK